MSDSFQFHSQCDLSIQKNVITQNRNNLIQEIKTFVTILNSDYTRICFKIVTEMSGATASSLAIPIPRSSDYQLSYVVPISRSGYSLVSTWLSRIILTFDDYRAIISFVLDLSPFCYGDQLKCYRLCH